MDPAFLDLVGLKADAPSPELTAKVSAVRLLDVAKGEVGVARKELVQTYTLKPVAELYGPDRQVSSVDPTNQRYMPLLFGIEIEITRYYGREPGLTDGMVALALDRLILNPAADPGSEELAKLLQLRLRVILSLCDYSKYEVVSGLRVIAKSVQRHTKASGIHGYLDFITHMFTAKR